MKNEHTTEPVPSSSSAGSKMQNSESQTVQSEAKPTLIGLRRFRLLCIAFGLAGAAGTAHLVAPAEAQDTDYTPPTGAADLRDARRSNRGVVLGAGAAPEVYTVRRGDTLWDITSRYFGDPYGWPRIWSYNPEITNPHWIYPNDHIRLREGGERPTVLDTGQDAPLRTREPSGLLLREQGFLDADAIEAAGVIIGSPEEQMLLSNYDEIYLRFEEGQDVEVDRDYTIFRQMDEDEREPNEEGELVRIFGTVHLRSYDRERGMGRGVITETLDPIERGFRVAEMPRRLTMVPPQENQQDLEASVVATLRPHYLSADYQVVFVDAGQEQGVLLGNRFSVVRQGDTWRDIQEVSARDYGATIEDAPEPEERDEYLPEIVAEGLVVDVRPNTSTLVITGSRREIVVGDRVEMRAGF